MRDRKSAEVKVHIGIDSCFLIIRRYEYHMIRQTSIIAARSFFIVSSAF